MFWHEHGLPLYTLPINHEFAANRTLVDKIESGLKPNYVEERDGTNAENVKDRFRLTHEEPYKQFYRSNFGDLPPGEENQFIARLPSMIDRRRDILGMPEYGVFRLATEHLLITTAMIPRGTKSSGINEAKKDNIRKIIAAIKYREADATKKMFGESCLDVCMGEGVMCAGFCAQQRSCRRAF